MTTVPCPNCNGEGFVPVKVCCGHRLDPVDGCCGNFEVDFEPCPRPRCIAGHIELTDAEVKAMEAEQANVRT